MTRRARALAVALLLGALAAPLTAQDLASETAERIARLVEERRETARIPAVVLAVARGGRVVHEAAFGFADLENRVQAKTATRFRTASIAKPMTAAAVMRLHERGELDLDGPVRELVPEWPAKHPPITPRQLLAHLGGVRHYRAAAEARGTRPWFDLVSTLELFADDDLVAPPGTRFRYTTYGYTLLGLVVERVTKQRFEDAMRELVWEPAGMSRTCADEHFRLIEDRARGYQRIDERTWRALPAAARARVRPGEVVNAWLHDTSMKVPGGGLLSTAGDLARFGLAMLSDRLVAPATRRAMWTRQRTAAGEEIPYGLGWSLGRLGEQELVSHGGGQAGTACFLAILPERGLVVAAMTNLRGAPVRRLVLDVVGVLEK